jgi:hypothetical protein
VQRYEEFDVRLDKKDMARLLEGVPNPDMVGWWPVAMSYRICSGSIYADNPQPIFEIDEERSLETDQFFADPDLFFSFARLGARGEPSGKSILAWVSKHGLLERENEKDDTFLSDTGGNGSEVNQAPITVERFRAEVLCAYQLLTLYTDIQEENVEALEARLYGTDGARHPSSSWPNTPSTELERFFATYRDFHADVIEGMRQVDKLIGFEVPEGQLVKLLHLSAALRALQHVVENRIADVRLGFHKSYFEENYVYYALFVSSPPLKRDYRIPRSWDCPDLLSAMYLQVYLLITDFEPMRRCKNPACGLPFPATRKNKHFCNATCRSNARNYR